MKRVRHLWPSSALISLVAALTTWVTLLAWTPFAERPSTYMVPLFGACLLVAVSGALLRSARLPAVLVALAQLLVLAVWLHHRWAAADAWAGWVPTAESLATLNETLALAVDAAQSYVAPIPKSVPQFAPLLVVAGSATAVLVDFLACGLRRAPVAGLPLLAVYTAPVSILDGGVSWLKFVLAALAFLGLIACQEADRLTHWGQQVSGGGRIFDSQSTRVSSQAVWSSARKIGLTATGLAVLVPIFVPTYSLGFLGGEGSGTGDGGSLSIDNPIADLRRDLNRGTDVDLLRVTTEDDDTSYLRISVLDFFDGEKWSPARRQIPVEQRAAGLVPRPPGLDPDVPRERARWSVLTSSIFDSQWLPAPYPVFSIEAPGDWRYDRDTLDFVSFPEDQSAAGLSYQLERIKIDPTAEQLAGAPPAPAEVFGPNTELPGQVPDTVRELARLVTEGADSRYESAVALQRWFRVDGGFRYSLERSEPGSGVDDLERFLFDTQEGRVGYCEQFAAAMALMGRSIGIPSRLAMGFLRPERDGASGYVYSAWDLHLWPEMYFEGIGWVRFEPTPAARTGRVPAYTRQTLADDPSSRSPSSAPLAPSQNRFSDQAAPTAGADRNGGASGFDTGLAVLVGGVTLALLALLALPRTLRVYLRRRRWESADTPVALAEAAWAELRDTALDLGISWSDDETVRNRARALVRSFAHPGVEEDALARAAARGQGAYPEADAALTRLVELVERARYSRSVPPSAAVVQQVEGDLDLCVAALRAGASRAQRTRARWLPASLWSRWSAAWAAGGRTDTGSLLDEPGVDHAI